MGRKARGASSVVSRWAVWAAARILPKSVRPEWERTRRAQAADYGALLGERGESRLAAAAKLGAFHQQLFLDAWRLRFPEWEPRQTLRRRARSPWAVLALAAAALAAIALASGGFRAVRTLRKPLPYADSSRLVSCYQVHFASLSLGVQARYVRPWQQQCRTLDGLEAYAPRRFPVSVAGGAGETVPGLSVTPGFFRLVGAEPRLGRLFGPEDAAGAPAAVLSWDYWQRRFGGDPGAVGRIILIDGRPVRIVGILSRDFWFRSPGIRVWTLLPNLESADPSLRLVSTIGRLKGAYTAEEARRELQRVAFSSSRFRGGAFRVVTLEQSLRPNLQVAALVFVATGVLAAAVALVQLLRSLGKAGEAGSGAPAYWLFFAAKVVVLLAVAAVAEAELAARNALNLYPSRFLFGLLIDWASVLAALFILRWAMLDQARRCPVCVRRLGVPVTSGSWSSALLEPATTEMLCDQGHGALNVADARSPFGEIRRWIAMEDSWRELLASENKSG
jgi:hypothetical protein